LFELGPCDRLALDVSSFDKRNGALAVIRLRDESPAAPGAQVIDLVHLPPGARPLPYAELDFEEVPGARALDCDTYHECLSLAARVQWRGFHCRRCPKFLGLPARPEGAKSDDDDDSGAPVIPLH